MKGTRAALRYAKAVLSLAKDSKKEADVNKSMLLIAETIDGNNELERVLNSPVIKVDDKIKVLQAIFSDAIDQISLGVIGLLGENKRLPLLSMVAKQYIIAFDHDKLRDVAKVTTAVPLTEELKDKVLAKIK
jgi:F-type H+-transporting ATPase subunit delta